jgi:hypothetical protein
LRNQDLAQVRPGDLVPNNVFVAYAEKSSKLTLPPEGSGISLKDYSTEKITAIPVQVPTTEPNSQLEPHWNSFRLELKMWFGRNAASLGELYEGALRILYSPRFPGRTRFIAHAVREIANRLPEKITGVKNQRFEWQNKLDGIVKSWERAGFPLDGNVPESVTLASTTVSAEVPIPRRLMQTIAEVLSEYAEGRETNQVRARRLFEGVDPQNQSSREAFTPIVTQWIEVTNWFVAIAHDSGKIDALLDTDELQRHFELFETTLGAVTREFFKTIGDLDEILENTNS